MYFDTIPGNSLRNQHEILAHPPTELDASGFGYEQWVDNPAQLANTGAAGDDKKVYAEDACRGSKAIA